MRTKEEILALYQQRRQRLSPRQNAAMTVQAAYYGDITIPLPELDANEKPLVANLLYSAGEQKAQRVASTMPDIYYPSAHPGFDNQDTAAERRRLVNLGWWDNDRMKLKMRKRARHMVYYAHSPVMVRPHFDEQRPTWQIRNPLGALAPEMDVGDVCPEDIIFTYPKSMAWMRRVYPRALAQFGNVDDLQDSVFTVLEYQDSEWCDLLVVGERAERYQGMFGTETRRIEQIVTLEHTENRVGRCTAVLAGGIGLDYPRGSFDGSIGMWQALGKIMALEAIGMQRAIWPEEWLVEDPNGEGAEIVTQADPLQGRMGLVKGGKLEFLTPNLNQQGTNLMDRLERGMRIESGIPAELGGESTSNIRTGKRGDQILSSVLDFPLQEMQEILAVSLQEENKIAIAIDKAYFPSAKSFYMSATAGSGTYVPGELFTTDTHFVKYAHAGVDAQGLVIEGAQRIGVGTLSKRSFMEMDPLVEDPQAEFDRINHERIRDGMLQSLAQMATDPQMAPIIAQVMIKLRNDATEVEDAVMAVHQEMQAAQAAQQQAQAQAQMGAPGAPGPEAQPGMGQPAIAAPPQSMGNLAMMLRQLKTGNNAGVPNQLGIAS